MARFLAMFLPELSGFGFNELLGRALVRSGLIGNTLVWVDR